MEQLRTHVAGDQYQEAFASVRAAKNWFWWLILAAVVIQIAGFILVRYGGVIDEAPAVTEPAGAKVAPATAPAADEQAQSANVWYQTLNWILPATKFIALAAGMLLILTTMFSVKLALLGRTGGVGGFMGAFFWSILLWVFLIPWQQALHTSVAAGALFNLGELVARTRPIIWDGEEASALERVFYYVRFLAYPLFVIVLQLIVQAKFARGYRRTTVGVSGELPEHAAPPEAEKM